MPTDAEKLEELESQITSGEERFYFGVLYGDFSRRKTSTAVRCARSSAVILHADRGWHVLDNHDDTRDKYTAVEYDGLSQIPAVVDAIVNNRGKFAGHDLLILDTYSQMQENFIDFVLENANYGGKYRDQLVPKQGKRGKFEALDVPAPVDYHVVRNQMRPGIEKCIKAPLDVLVLAHLREPGPMDKKQVRRPNITESVYKVVARDATFIGFMEVKAGEYTIDFKESATLSAKSQIPTLQGKIKTQDLPEILWKWKDR